MERCIGHDFMRVKSSQCVWFMKWEGRGGGVFSKPDLKKKFFLKGVSLWAYAFRSRFSHVPGALVHMLSHSSLEYSGAASRDQKDGCIKKGATTEEMWENSALRRDRDTQKCPNSAGSVSANQTLTAPPHTPSPLLFTLHQQCENFLFM